MKRLILTILLLLLLPTHAVGLEVRFKKDANVNRSTIRLGDIVTFDEQTPTAQALASQIITQAPEPGGDIILRSDRILQELHRNLPVLPPNTKWSGAVSVSIHRNGITIDSSKIAAIISEYISSHKADLPDADIRFIPATLPLPFILPRGEMRYEVIPSDPSILGSSRFSIIFRVDDTVVKNMSVRGRTEAIAPVVVSATPVKRGTILQPRHLRLVPKDISHLPGYSFSIENVSGKKLTRSLRSGSPVLRSMLTTLPVVHRGEKVKIVVQSGPMILTATGVAFKDGRTNQMIRVQNLSSKKIVYCRVAAPGLVEVVL